VLYAEGEDDGERPRPARKILVHVGTVLARAHPGSADRRSASSRRSTRIQVCGVKRRRIARSSLYSLQSRSMLGLCRYRSQVGINIQLTTTVGRWGAGAWGVAVSRAPCASPGGCVVRYKSESNNTRGRGQSMRSEFIRMRNRSALACIHQPL